MTTNLTPRCTAACAGFRSSETLGGEPVITQIILQMESIYDFVANLFGLSHDWAVLLVQLGIVFGDIILLILLLPWLVNKFQREFYPKESTQFRPSRGCIPYWYRSAMVGLSHQQREHQKMLLYVGIDYILEICMKHNLERVVKNEPLDFDFSDIKKVVAAWAGYVRDVRVGETYRWIIELHNGQYRYIRGWFDPSRHEERTSLFTWSADSAEEAAQIDIQPDILAKKGHKNFRPSVVTDHDVYLSLLDQIKSGERDWSGFKLGYPSYAP